MRRTLTLLLALMTLVCSIGAFAEQAPAFVGMPNPMYEYASIDEIREDYPNIEMVEPSPEAQNVRYFVIDSGDGFPIAEVRCTVYGVEYTYRCMPRPEGVVVYTQDSGYLAGLYYTFDINETETIFSGASNVTIDYHYCTASNIGCAIWYDREAKCEYSLAATTPYVDLKTAARTVAQVNTRQSSISGTVMSITATTLTLKLENGNAIVLPCELDTDARPGDRVTVTYSGSLTENPYVIAVHIDAAAATFSGTVTEHDRDTVTVRAANGTTIIFTLLPDTLISGRDYEIKNNAEVTVTYVGSLESAIYATEVYIDAAGEEIDPSLIDKQLKGTVVKLTSEYMKIRTSKNKKYTFLLTEDTEYTGRYELAVKSKVTVTYDGYASESPVAKVVKVTAEPEPTPEPEPEPTPTPTPKVKKVSGMITSVCGIWITLDDGNVYTVNSSNCKIVNPENCKEGHDCVLKYKIVNGERVCVKATFKEMRLY